MIEHRGRVELSVFRQPLKPRRPCNIMPVSLIRSPAHHKIPHEHQRHYP